MHRSHSAISWVAQLPATAVTQIAALDDVRRIGLDTAPVPTLNSSAQIMYAPSFWNAGYDGGIHDIGVIEYGVDNHPYLRSGLCLHQETGQ